MTEKKKPGARCHSCQHPKRAELDKDVVRGMSMRTIARKYGLQTDSVHRHARNHLDETRRKELLIELRHERATEIDEEINQDRVDISSGLQRIIREIERILNRSKEAGDDQLALTALRDMKATLLDLARLHGQLQNVTTVQINVAELPQWSQLRGILVEVFNEVPAAREVFMRKTRHLKLIEAR